MTLTNDTRLSPRFYSLLALFSAALGLSAAWVTIAIFVLGMQRLEPDPAVRAALSGMGTLLVAAELATFGLAGLLPARTMRGLRAALVVVGVLLLAFETVTIYVTQVSVARTEQAREVASASRIADLKASISDRRHDADGLRVAAAAQTASRFVRVRNEGVQALQNALREEPAIAADSRELAELQKQIKPSATSILGERGMVIYVAGRALLLACVGSLFMTVAGALMRTRRDVIAACVCIKNDLKPATPTFDVPMLRAVGGRFALAAVAVAMPVLSVAGPVVTLNLPSFASMMMQTKETSAAKIEAVHQQDSGLGKADGARFQRARAAILNGIAKPSLRSLYAFCGASQPVAQRYLAAMVRAGEIVRTGRSYSLVWRNRDHSRSAVPTPAV
jgi:hypothetical protein